MSSACQRYGPGAASPAVAVTRGPLSAYAPVSSHASAMRPRSVPSRGDHGLVDRVEHADRAPGLAGDGRGQRLHLGVGLAAEAAAEERHDHPHRVERQPEQRGDLLPDQERVLA